jgi:hypothetical protein
MRVSGLLYGGGEIFKTYKVGATFANAGIIAIDDGNTVTGGPIPCTTTDSQDSIGLTIDTGTYDATPAVGGTGTVEVSVRPDIIINATMSGGATESTALAICTETAGDTASPDTVTATNVQANDMVSGTAWRRQKGGNEAGILEQATIITHTGSTSFVVIPDFEYAINIGDEFLMCPWNAGPLDGTATTDGSANVQTTTLFTQADATVASGTGLVVNVVGLILRDTNNSEVEFVQAEHAWLAIN